MRTVFACLAVLLAWGFANLAMASGPVETSPYAVQGVEVDVTDANAAAAKQKALVEVQMRAFAKLGDVLGNATTAAEMAKMTEKQVVPMLKSLSIEEEKISPGRYQGKFTVRFLPDRIKPILTNLGVQIPASQGPAMLVVPVWKNEQGQAEMWDDNVWRKAWLSLNAQQAQIPLIIPLGDHDDSSMMSAQDALNGDPVKLEALRRRYEVDTILVAIAEPSPDGGIRARVSGQSPLGKVTIDKVYRADSGTLNDSAIMAAQRFQQLMIEKFRSDQAKAAAKQANPNAPQSVVVAIPFTSPTAWNGLRARILSTPGVLGVDVTSLDGQGASAKLIYSGNLQDMQSSLQATGLQMQRSGSSWIIQQI
ncbi:MAG: DUF2066 domain-containing protein [Alphaproteobacteria bacterium]|nr:DUF2066 domain-containing protein [Alphaproteobacteria bacterium]